MVAGSEPGGEAELVQVAAGLIEVEDHLDDQLVGLILPRKKSEAGEAETEAQDQDFQQVQSAVLRECVVNLARIKEYVAQNVSGTLDAAGLRQLARAHARHQGRPADARQDPRGRDHRGASRST